MPRVALVHEFLTQLGGAERVLENLIEIFPDAPIFTLVHDRKKTKEKFAGLDIRTSFVQKLPGGVKKYKWYLPLLPKAIESFDLRAYDLVISDSSAFAKGIKTKKPTLHICYCHTPTRYLWESMGEYVKSLAYPGIIKKVAKLYLRHYLKNWDYHAAQRPDYFVANSHTVEKRIKKYYNRESSVIYPPVDTEFFRVTAEKKGYYFTASRLEPYKKIDLVVGAFNKLGFPLKVAGSGTDFDALKNDSQKNIEFLGAVSDNELRNLYSGAEAFIFPAFEDSGIMVLEALSCGTPVIGFAQGGTAEFVRDGENGILFTTQSAEAIIDAIGRLHDYKFESDKLRDSVLQFSQVNFRKNITSFIKTKTGISL